MHHWLPNPLAGLRVDWRVSAGLVGRALQALAVPLLFPLVLAFAYGEPPEPFLGAIAATLALGSGLAAVGRTGDLHVREALLATSTVWLLFALVGAVPFLLAGDGTTARPVNALFESMSGITTTGATVWVDFDAHTRSVAMWRQLIQWIGGLGIVIIATAILPEVGVGGAQLMETETWTATVTRLRVRIAETARLLSVVYVVVTGVFAGALYVLYLLGVAPNMTAYNALAHSFTAVATAGFSPEPASAGAFAPVAQWVLLAAMLVGGTRFPLLYLSATDRLGHLLESEELHFYLATAAGAAALVALALDFDPGVGFGFEATVRHALFNTVSLLTTTGFASTDFDLWSAAAKHVLFASMFLGAMVGSTTCSIKSLRWLVVLKSMRRDLFTTIHPSAVRPVRVGEEVVPEESLRDVYSFVLLSILLVFTLTAFVVIDAARVGLAATEFEAMGAAASTFLNVGPAFGFAGPYGSYAAFPATTKVAMIVLMWVGRVEIVPVLVLLTAAFWRS